MKKNNFLLLVYIFLLFGCESTQIKEALKKQSIELFPSKEGDNRGNITNNDTVIFGKITVFSKGNFPTSNITKHCLIKLYDSNNNEINANLYGRKYYLAAYSNLGSDSFFAAKIQNTNKVKFSSIDCFQYKVGDFLNPKIVSRNIQPLDYEINIQKDKNKYYFGNLEIYLSNKIDIKKYDNYIEDSKEFENSIPSAKLLETKKSTLKFEDSKKNKKEDEKRVDRILNEIKFQNNYAEKIN